MNLRERIKNDVIRSVGQWVSGSVGNLEKLVEVVRTSDPRFGDYTSNVAMVLAKRIKHLPMEFAKKLADSLKDQVHIRKLEVKEPGFTNFFIKDEVWQKEVENFSKKKTFESAFSGKKVIIEFTDPNPFKQFHVGHLYSNSVGESISRLLEACGAKVGRANYQGDVGLHVAKCIWGMRRVKESPRQNSGRAKSQRVKDLEELRTASLAKRIEFLGTSYAAGAEAYETNEEAKNAIIELNKEIYEKMDEIEEYKLGKKWSLENFEVIYKRLGTKFDLYYFESEVGANGAQIVKKNIGKVFENSEGAVIFSGEKYGLHNRVFINKLGLPTYEAKELGLAFKKYEDFAYDESIIVTGNEIVEYFKVLFRALALIDNDLAAKQHHVAHGMVRMPGGKVSSRLGNVISATNLLDEAKKRATALAGDSSKGKEKLSKGQAFAKESTELRPGLSLEHVAEQVAVGAIKYAMLRGNLGQDIKFSYEEAMSLEGNSGPYLQYTYARCRSVLEKSKVPSSLKLRWTSKSQKSKVDFSKAASEEMLLLRVLGHFEEAVIDAASSFAPNQIANFLFEVAQKYNGLYNNLRIIDAKEPDRARRLFLTMATAQILQKGLDLLGISAPEKM